MALLNTQAVRFALIPGAVESLERHANNEGNMALHGMAISMKYARNALYIGVALTVIATIGAVLAITGTALQYTCAIVAILGIGLAIFSAKKLYDAIVFLQSTINSGARS